MQKSAFMAYCPYEIGDKVRTFPDNEVETITDIRTIHYLSSRKVMFEFQTEKHPYTWFALNKIICRTHNQRRDKA